VQYASPSRRREMGRENSSHRGTGRATTTRAGIRTLGDLIISTPRPYRRRSYAYAFRLPHHRRSCALRGRTTLPWRDNTTTTCALARMPRVAPHAAHYASVGARFHGHDVILVWPLITVLQYCMGLSSVQFNILEEGCWRWPSRVYRVLRDVVREGRAAALRKINAADLSQLFYWRQRLTTTRHDGRNIYLMAFYLHALRTTTPPCLPARSLLLNAHGDKSTW